MKKFIGFVCVIAILGAAPSALGKSCAAKCYDARINALTLCMIDCRESFRPGTASRASCLQDCKTQSVDDYHWCKNLCKDRY